MNGHPTPSRASLQAFELQEFERTLPVPPEPVAHYLPVRQAGNLVFTSGQTNAVQGHLEHAGKVGRELSIREGQAAAETAVLNCLSALNRHLGSLDRIKAVVSLTGYVASTEGFTDQPQVINGASLLLDRVLGERGRHSRAALGVSELPGGAAVEIMMIVEV